MSRSRKPIGRHPGGRPASSRDVRVIGQRRALDHQALARVLLALLASKQPTAIAGSDDSENTPHVDSPASQEAQPGASEIAGRAAKDSGIGYGKEES